MSTFKRLISAAVLVAAAIAPVAVSADDNGQKSATTQNFCVRIASVRGELNSKLTKLESDRGKNRNDILGKLKVRKTTEMGDVQKMRDDGKQKFADAIANVEGTATTDAQKAAVETFKASVNAAMTTRKTAVDAATLAFRTARDPLVAQRQNAVKPAVAALKASVAADIAKAQADCKVANSDPVVIRQALIDSIKAAVTQFHTAVAQALGTINQQIADLATTRNTAVKAANTAFKAAVAQARQTLKLAFPAL